MGKDPEGRKTTKYHGTAKTHDGDGGGGGGGKKERKSKHKLQASMSKKSRSASILKARDQPESIDGESEEEGADEANEQNQQDSLRKTLDLNFNHMRDSYMRFNQGLGKGRYIVRNAWEVCCNETEDEIKELDFIMKKMGLPSVHYTKMKYYEITDYDTAPDMETCKAKDFLDFYVFPCLLSAIQALIQFAKVNRVFQTRVCTFNALDFIVEYLYNNNPRYPKRVDNPTPLFEIPFCKEYLVKNPRPPPPKWMLMTSEEAAVIIQRAIRGWLVRVKPEVQEMRQFWKEIRKDLEAQRQILAFGRSLPDSPLHLPPFSPYYDEVYGEMDESVPVEQSSTVPPPQPLSPIVSHHSDNCAYCNAFRKFIETQPEEILKSYAKRPSNTSVGGGDSDGATVQKSMSGNEEEGGLESGVGEGTATTDDAAKEQGGKKMSAGAQDIIPSASRTAAKSFKKKRKQEG